MTWSKRFDVPIDAGAKQLMSLRDAATYITALPKAEQHRTHWHTAIEMLLKAAEKGWPVMMAGIAMRRAINHGKSPPAVARGRARKYRVIR